MLLNDEGLPILGQNSEEGFVDLAFKIVGLKSDEGYCYFDLLASHDNERVGLTVKMVRTIGPGFDSEIISSNITSITMVSAFARLV